MSAEETWTYRSGGSDGENKLMKIGIATGEATELPAGPGVKLLPAVLPSGEIAYLRHDAKGSGIFYGNGKAGPTGKYLQSPSWSPDGAHVVYGRFVFNHGAEPVKMWSRNSKFDLYNTAWLPAYDSSGEHLAVTKMISNHTTNLLIVDEGKPGRSILEQNGLILGPSWSPDGKQIVVGVGGFTAFLDFASGGLKPADPVNGGAQVGIFGAEQ
jgi:dipeptidyl aminopeptidase/acylaminoacyl peptidase